MNTYTHAQTWTKTDSRYISSKIRADLELLQFFYGRPQSQSIENYAKEVEILLRFGCLDYMVYGFERAGQLLIAMKYTADYTGFMDSDDRAGGIRRDVDISSSAFYSYVSYSLGWYKLDRLTKEKLIDMLPIKRTSVHEPLDSQHWKSDRNYSSNAVGVSRAVYVQ